MFFSQIIECKNPFIEKNEKLNCKKKGFENNCIYVCWLSLYDGFH